MICFGLNVDLLTIVVYTVDMTLPMIMDAQAGKDDTVKKKALVILKMFIIIEITTKDEQSNC